MTEPVKLKPPSIQSMVADMEDCITRAEYYTETIGTLIEYIEQPENIGATMSLVQQDLGSAVIEARRRWRELDAEAKGGAA